MISLYGPSGVSHRCAYRPRNSAAYLCRSSPPFPDTILVICIHDADQHERLISPIFRPCSSRCAEPDNALTLSMLSACPASLRRPSALQLSAPAVTQCCPASAAAHRPTTAARRSQLCVTAVRFENRELLIGDCTSLLSFCLYKQVGSSRHIRFERFERFGSAV